MEYKATLSVKEFPEEKEIFFKAAIAWKVWNYLKFLKHSKIIKKNKNLF